jgi:hypothetical protein
VMRRARRRCPPRRRAIARPQQAPDPRRPNRHTSPCPRPPALEWVPDRTRGRGHDRRGRIQDGMNTGLDRRGVQHPDLVMDYQARAGRIRPDIQDASLFKERRFEAVRDGSILMKGRNAQPQAPARLMTHLHLGPCQLYSVRTNRTAILIRMILDNKSSGDGCSNGRRRYEGVRAFRLNDARRR